MKRNTILSIVAIILALIGIGAELVGVCHTDASVMVGGCIVAGLAICVLAWEYPD